MNLRNNTLIVNYHKIIEFIRKQGVKRWLAVYLLVFLVFATIYYFMPKTTWVGEIDNFIDALYFSVVTITSLGFGDISPGDNSWAKILVSLESIGGVLIIGFFLNDVAQQQAIRLDKQNREMCHLSNIVKHWGL